MLLTFESSQFHAFILGSSDLRYGSTHPILRCTACTDCHLIAQRADQETGWKLLKAKLCLECRNAGNIEQVPTSKYLWLLWKAFALSGSRSIICFSICGWSALGLSNTLQEYIWGDNPGNQWAFAGSWTATSQTLSAIKNKASAKHQGVEPRSGWNLESDTCCSPSNQYFPTPCPN